MFKSPLIIAALGGIAIVGAIVLNFMLWQNDDAGPQAENTPASPQVIAPDKPLAAAPNQPASPEKQPMTTPIKIIPPVMAKSAPALQMREPDNKLATIKAPSFDVVRITPEGDAVFAGRAMPGSKVVIIDNGQFVGQLTSDPHGEWVFVPEKPFAPGSRQLGLEMHIEGREPIPSDDVVVLVVPEPNKDIAGRATDKPTRPLALKFPKKGGPSTVLQKPSGDAGGEILSVDTVDYDADGRLMISGRAQPGTSVFIYLDRVITGKAQVDRNGGWRLRPENRVKPGVYTLRADQVTTSGKVMARISLPFARAEPMEDMPSEPFVIVQPGNSLWRIARSTYGSGFGFTTIYEANKEQIKDPDLIFPGQVFALPSNNL